MMKRESQASYDLGPRPVIINMRAQACKNNFFRTALWTGRHLQITVMSIPCKEEIGLEMHLDLDQLIRIESGSADVFTGDSPKNLEYAGNASAGSAVTIPAGTWHNLINVSGGPLKLSSVYAPTQHPYGTVHKTRADSDSEHH